MNVSICNVEKMEYKKSNTQIGKSIQVIASIDHNDSGYE